MEAGGRFIEAAQEFFLLIGSGGAHWEQKRRNQRDEETTPGTDTILLPSHEHGPVRLPGPPGGATDLTGAAPEPR